MRDFPGAGVKSPVKLADALRAAQEKDAARIQAVVKKREEFPLQFRAEIDEQIAAAEDVQLGEGRVHDEILRRKDDHLADLLDHLVAAFVLDEDTGSAAAAETSARDIRREDAQPRFIDRVAIQIGGVDLQREVALLLRLFERLLEDDGQ